MLIRDLGIPGAFGVAGEEGWSRLSRACSSSLRVSSFQLALDEMKQLGMPATPKTPQSAGCDSQSRLESLPMDLLVKILCHLHHDQLKAVFHVSQRTRAAVILAKQLHFNYTTPDRSRQEMLRIKTLPTEHWPFVSKAGRAGMWEPSLHTPKAPKHGSRPSRFKLMDMKHIAAVLFQSPICLQGT